MPIPCRLAALAVTAVALTPSSAWALDEYLRASSGGPTELGLCKADGDLAKSGACREYDLDALTKKIERSLRAALVKAPANVKPLLKRDQVWFNEIMSDAAENRFADADDEQKETYVERLRRRQMMLDKVAQGFGRGGIAGNWLNAFGSLRATPTPNGYRLTMETSTLYGAGSEPRRDCKVIADVKSGSDRWLTGTLLSDRDAPAKATDDKSEPSRPPSIKVQRQGESLRVVIGNEEIRDADWPNCPLMGQLTGSWFADGKTEAAASDKAVASFVTPTFDCARPSSASEEEICADPDLADNDRKLNRAWKALLPRLDETTRRALSDDQRAWVRAQTNQYPQFLHPAWEKQSSSMHYTADGRDKLDRLQKERIALLEGFDEKRSGLAGIWLSHTAVLKVAIAEDGSLQAQGWKWDQGDWKAGCDFDIKGKVTGGVFRSEEKRKNPDTLERDHSILIVNRQDDVFAEKRGSKDDGDEPKCRRNIQISSTARLFPAKPSPDIDNLGGSIR